jgi:hypothetical protein
MSTIKAWICLPEGTHVFNLDSKVDCLWKHWFYFVCLCGTLWFYFVCGNTLIYFVYLWEHYGFTLLSVG